MVAMVVMGMTTSNFTNIVHRCSQTPLAYVVNSWALPKLGLLFPFRYVRLKPGCDSATRIDKFILLSDQTGAQINGLLDDLWKKTHLWKAINVS